MKHEAWIKMFPRTNLGIFQFALLVYERITSACLICPALAEVVDYLQSPTKTSSMRDFVRLGSTFSLGTSLGSLVVNLKRRSFPSATFDVWNPYGSGSCSVYIFPKTGMEPWRYMTPASSHRSEKKINSGVPCEQHSGASTCFFHSPFP